MPVSESKTKIYLRRDETGKDNREERGDAAEKAAVARSRQEEYSTDSKKTANSMKRE